MAKEIILSANEVSPDWITYCNVEAHALAKLDDFEIENYGDREMFNPEMQDLFQSTRNTLVLSAKVAPVYLSFAEESAARALGGFFDWFRGLKRRILEIACSVFEKFGDGLPSWDEIIQAVLLAVAGTLFGGVLGAVVLPIVVAIVARIIKKGVGRVCNI